MAESPEAVVSFLEELSTRIRGKADEVMAAMLYYLVSQLWDNFDFKSRYLCPMDTDREKSCIAIQSLYPYPNIMLSRVCFVTLLSKPSVKLTCKAPHILCVYGVSLS